LLARIDEVVEAVRRGESEAGLDVQDQLLVAAQRHVGAVAGEDGQLVATHGVDEVVPVGVGVVLGPAKEQKKKLESMKEGTCNKNETEPRCNEKEIEREKERERRGGDRDRSTAWREWR